MKIKIIYSGRLSKAANIKMEWKEVAPAITVSELVEILGDAYGNPFRKALCATDNKTLRLPVFVNSVRRYGDYVLSDGDTVLFSRVVIGG
jgi:molybdopterin converting factor small subunit